jgi:hypothetical protein
MKKTVKENDTVSFEVLTGMMGSVNNLIRRGWNIEVKPKVVNLKMDGSKFSAYSTEELLSLLKQLDRDS